MAELALLVDPKGLPGQDFLCSFSMALYRKWDVKNGFSYVLQFFSLISDSLGGVPSIPTALFRDGGKTENLGGLEVIFRLIFDGTGFDHKSNKIWGGRWSPYPHGSAGPEFMQMT